MGSLLTCVDKRTCHAATPDMTALPSAPPVSHGHRSGAEQEDQERLAITRIRASHEHADRPGKPFATRICLPEYIVLGKVWGEESNTKDEILRLRAQNDRFSP